MTSGCGFGKLRRKSFMTKKLQQYDINMGHGWRDRDVLAAFISLGADERVMKDR